jgi:hypothetical protein
MNGKIMNKTSDMELNDTSNTAINDSLLYLLPRDIILMQHTEWLKSKNKAILALLEAIESSKRFNDKLDNVELKSNN